VRTPRRRREKRRYISTYSNSHHERVISRLNLQLTLQEGKSPLVPIERNLCGNLIWSGRCGEPKYLLPLRRNEPRPSGCLARSAVTIPTALSWLCHEEWRRSQFIDLARYRQFVPSTRSVNRDCFPSTEPEVSSRCVTRFHFLSCSHVLHISTLCYANICYRSSQLSNYHVRCVLWKYRIPLCVQRSVLLTEAVCE
jgi:hypothetical protein